MVMWQEQETRKGEKLGDGEAPSLTSLRILISSRVFPPRSNSICLS